MDELKIPHISGANMSSDCSLYKNHRCKAKQHYSPDENKQHYASIASDLNLSQVKQNKNQIVKDEMSNFFHVEGQRSQKNGKPHCG